MHSGLRVSSKPIPSIRASVVGPPCHFLKLDGILGESTDAKHKGEIQRLSFSWGSSNPGATGSASGGAGAGKVSITNFHFAATTSQASPLLFLATATRKHLKTGPSRAPKRAWPAGQGGGDGTVPVDAASLSFSKIKYSFYPQRADGSLGAPVAATWDLQANKVS
jgi:type VI secretion system secreted protein Hcp